MILFRKSIACLFLAALEALFTSGGFAAASPPKAPRPLEQLEYEELRAKLSIDAAPLPKGESQVVSYADMLEKVMKSVVTISSKQEQSNSQLEELLKDPALRKLFRDKIPEELDPRKHPTLPVTGCGVVISSDGYILTNNHVVEQSKGLEVAFGPNLGVSQAKVIASDSKSDVALIKVEAQGLQPIAIGDSGRLRVGDVTFAIGNPFGLEQTVTMGIVSALGRGSGEVGLVAYADFIQTDAAINRGNSGGALVDAKGRLVGINTAIQSGFGGGNVGIGFAIPSNMALEVVRKLLEGGGVVRRGFLGVQLEKLDSDLAEALGWKQGYGVAVAQVYQNTPAAQAGFQPYDIITSYQGRKAASLDSLRLTISNTDPNENVKFGVFRKGKEITLELRLAQLPNNTDELFASATPGSAPAREFLKGVKIAELKEANRAENGVAEDVQGVLVEAVETASSAAEAGLEPGMVIQDVNRTAVRSVEEAVKAREAFKGKKLLLRVSDRGLSSILTVKLQE